ncbi:MAG: type II toxin-antitoxin system RelE/ParE family toxin [Gemmatimonadaceae bacterium]
MESKWLEFVYLPMFERQAKGARLSENQRRELELSLVANPEAGSLIVWTGGFRKVRLGTDDAGKRGGFRVIYYYRAAKERIYLLSVYRKNEKDSLTASEKGELRAVSQELKLIR